MAEKDALVRIQPAGVRVRRAQRRASIVASGALVVGAATLAFVMLRPLPAAQLGDRVSIPSAPSPRAIGDPIERREQRLAALARAGNAFAPDRQPWKPDEIVPTPTDEPELQPEAPAALAGAPDAAPPVITLTERPTAAAKKSRDALDLLGVFASGDNRFAMIRGGEFDRRKDVELYREDDVFSAETWRVLRIVAEEDYIILEHLGQGDIVALSMYDTEIPSVAAAPPASTDPVIASATADEAAARMVEAGIDQSDVNEVLEMLGALERGEDITPPEDEAAVVAGAPANEAPAPVRKPGSPPDMPPALTELLRSMAMDARKSRESDAASKDETPN